MTWNPGAWAIDGSELTGSLARVANRAAVKESGIVSVGDLKVTQLGTPGNGIQISAGGAVIENLYVSNSGQSYAVENLATETAGPATVGWPATNPGVARSHLVCVSIGDPQYSTAGHPWLTDGNKPSTPEEALDFQYVRTVIIPNVPAGTKRVEDLPVPPAYPVYAIARLDLSTTWTTITNAQIVDLRKVVNARTSSEQWNVAVASDDLLNPPGTTPLTYEIWPDNSTKDVYIPKWATKVYVTGWIQSFLKGADILQDARMRVSIFDAGTRKVAGQAVTFYNDSLGTGVINTRHTVLLGAPMDIPSGDRGVIRQFSTEGALWEPVSMKNKMKTDQGTSVMISLRFVEEAV
jgi:hypothetical protein